MTAERQTLGLCSRGMTGGGALTLDRAATPRYPAARDLLMRPSPLSYSDQVTVPTLVNHGEVVQREARS